MTKPNLSRGIFTTPSGRRWAGHTPCRVHGERCVLMTPLGDDIGFGGVKRRHVDRERIERGDKTWRPA